MCTYTRDGVDFAYIKKERPAAHSVPVSRQSLEGDSLTSEMNELANRRMLASTGDLHCVCTTHVYVHT